MQIPDTTPRSELPTVGLMEVEEGVIDPARLAVAQSHNPFVVCWGDHTGPCPLLEPLGHPGTDPHGIVIELDYEDPGHRMQLRWIRRLAQPSAVIHLVPRLSLTGTQSPEARRHRR